MDVVIVITDIHSKYPGIIQYLSDCKPMHTLMVKRHYLIGDMCLVKQSEVQRMKRVSYSSVIESLMYNVLCARLDICFVVGFVSRFQSVKLKIKLYDTNRVMK